MKVAIYPGSFNPWHIGHSDILRQARYMFDLVIVAQGINPNKSIPDINDLKKDVPQIPGVKIEQYTGLLKDFIKKKDASVIIKGLRNTQDFEYEKIQQYWNEDLGIEIPTIYLIADRKLVHISSSAIKAVESFRK